jgi:hypothetical protein
LAAPPVIAKGWNVSVSMILFTAFVARWLLALVFGLASIAKASRPASLNVTLRSLNVPYRSASALTFVVVTTEAVVAIGLILSIAPLVIVTLAALLLLGFVGAAVVAMIRDDEILCNCFGPHVSTLGVGTLFRSLALAVVLAIYFFTATRTRLTLFPHNVVEGELAGCFVIAALLLWRWISVAPSMSKSIRHRHQAEYALTVIDARSM